MTREDWTEFNSLMGEMALAFRTDISKESIKVYGKHLADYSLDAVAHAITKAIQTADKFPLIKTLRELANGYRPTTTRQPVTDAVQIAEFTETEIAESKQKLSEIINGLADSMG